MPRLDCNRARSALSSLERSFSILKTQLDSFVEDGNELAQMNCEQLVGTITDQKVRLEKNLPIGFDFDRAIDIMGSHVLMSVETHDPIPFSQAELEDALENAEFLVYRSDVLPNGVTSTLRNILSSLPEERKPRFHQIAMEANMQREIIGTPFNVDLDAMLQKGWVLSSIAGLKGTSAKPFKEQNEVILKKLQTLQKKFGPDRWNDQLVKSGDRFIQRLDSVEEDRPDTNWLNRNYAARLNQALEPFAHFRPMLVELVYDLSLMSDQVYQNLANEPFSVITREPSFGRMTALRINPKHDTDLQFANLGSGEDGCFIGFQRYF